MKIIEPTQSEWTASIIFEPEINGSIPLCADCCTWSAVTVRPSYTFSSIEGCMDLPKNDMIFSPFNYSSGYQQMGTTDEDKDWVQLASHYEWNGIICKPVGLCNLTWTFQQGMDVSILPHQRHFNLIYLNRNLPFPASRMNPFSTFRCGFYYYTEKESHQVKGQVSSK